MAYYFVDFENVSEYGLVGIDELTEQDEVCIFYSKNANHLTFEYCNLIKDCRAFVHFYKASVGHSNALDFQLVTTLGYIVHLNISKGKHARYVIVSKDQGFNSVIHFWKQNKNLDIIRTVNIRGDTQEKPVIKHKSICTTVEKTITVTECAVSQSTVQVRKEVVVLEWVKTHTKYTNYATTIAQGIQSQKNKETLNRYLLRHINCTSNTNKGKIVSVILKDLEPIFTKENNIDIRAIGTL